MKVLRSLLVLPLLIVVGCATSEAPPSVPVAPLEERLSVEDGERVKVFSEWYASDLEKKTNDWLAKYKNELEIVRIANVSDGNRHSVAIFYKKKPR